ncbi:hypothetical protein, partial [Gordonia sp. (in: high G+C Gram-positive bacteria)]|uniref:hypothetical protein n=1 Tax=Gordonia sp. (in: high G+C Gram-positive bacteria) TaxID=84139 RepID=UPI003C750E9F
AGVGAMTLVVAGTAGAEPAALADALRAGGWSGEIAVVERPAQLAAHPGPIDAAILALDSSMPASHEEEALLAELGRRAIPTALTACRVDAFPAWPQAVAVSRTMLDPGRRLPLFAVATVLADVPGAASGVDDLVDWCREPPKLAVPDTAVPDSADRPAIGTDARAPRAVPGPGRADRVAGLRAGVVATRAELVTAVRTATTDLGVTIAETEPAAGFEDWLRGVLDELDRRVMATAVHRLDQVCGVATRGSAGAAMTVGPVRAPQTGAEPAPAPPPAGRRSEDLMVILVGASLGFGVGRMVIAPALHWAGFGVAGTVLSIAAGLLLACWVVLVRRTGTHRAQLHRWAAATVAARRAGLEYRIGAYAAAVEAQCGRAIWAGDRAGQI